MSNRNRTPVATRLDRRLDKSGGCWLWTGGKARYGYGTIRDATSRLVPAHRLAYELANGPIPDGMMVLHSCDVPACCNPSHLFLGTHQVNMADRQAKGRTARRGRHGRAKLTEEAVADIIARVAAGELQRAAGAAHGVSQGHVSDIINGKKWS